MIISPQRAGIIDLKWLFKELAKQQITSILIEGGAKTIGNALKANVVDKVWIFIAPKIVADERALNSIVGFNVAKIDQSINLYGLTFQKINSDLLITGYVHRNR